MFIKLFSLRLRNGTLSCAESNRWGFQRSNGFIPCVYKRLVTRVCSQRERISPTCLPGVSCRADQSVSFTMDLKKPISNLTDVALRITKQLLTTEGKGKNMVYSPLSLQVLLSSVTAGSKGPTKKQLLSFLKFKSSDELNSLVSHLVPLVLSDGSTRGGPCVNSANSLWVEQSLTVKPSFKRMLVNVYNAVFKEVSFATDPDKARVQVNSWTKKETKGLIPEALPSGSVDENTRLLLLNTIYFKGVWSDQFDPSETEECKFRLLDGSTVKAPFTIESYGWHYVSLF